MNEPFRINQTNSDAKNLYKKEKKGIKKIWWYITGLIVLVALIFNTVMVRTLALAPKDFKDNSVITVKKGDNIYEVAKMLQDKSIISSEQVFVWFARLMGVDRNIVSGSYVIEKQLPLGELLERLRFGLFGDRIRITFPEGMHREQIANQLEGKLPNFKKVEFMRITKGQEGYLFPDTYNFLPAATASDVATQMRENFDEKIKTLEAEFKRSKFSREDIIIMASIVEKEANAGKERNVIAGILWERIRIGKPLQVDAPFLYTLGKASKDITKDDLNTDTPFNTYRNKGLPPAPINNPGLATIRAALNPIKTNYLFYLHDARGNIHYAADGKGHMANVNIYLR